ncbi:hypothetical protein [Chryseobacterium sp. EO14]|uniref:hypothetical protein n=1 Tax=Chryseobacterium sp. EO14 TaxID=2950551 RepID=UPI0021097EF3|nr:hypothetical protein [Chryseobacterium sp. EO14]MCQ4140139.1 hypothetical protein [Chryseobacterium sp. EO14]
MDQEKINKRWNPYVLLHNDTVKGLWTDHFSKDGTKALFIMGKGFDGRMNLCIESLLEKCPNLDLKTMLINFDEGKSSNSHEYADLVEDNLLELQELLKTKQLEHKSIKLWSRKGKKMRRIGDREAANIFEDFDSIKDYTNILVDISALPRGIYFSLIGKLLKLIDTYCTDFSINLFVCVAENASIDNLIQENSIDEDLDYLYGFGGEISLEANSDKPLIWFPILGETKASHIRKAFEKVTESKDRLYEICPTLPFPSKNPRRSDTILNEYHELLFDELSTEPQNIMYVHERNPFEVYNKLSEAVDNYQDSLEIIKGCKIALSSFSSKLLSIGTLLTAFENNESVGVLNVDSQGYKIVDKNSLKSLKSESELFVTWLTGLPYNDTSK